MAEPYVGEIILFGGNFAPSGFMQCQGQILAISQYEMLFDLINVTYGGDDEETFALPDLRGRVPVGIGQAPKMQNYAIGQAAGFETVTPTVAQMPYHTHGTTACLDGGNTGSPTGTYLAGQEIGGSQTQNLPFAFAPFDPLNQVPLQTGAVSMSGNSAPHNNVQPVLALTYCIALFGFYPQAH